MDLTPPPGIDLKESQQGQLYAVYTVTYVLALVAVGLRFFCRLSVKRTTLWWDDYMSLLALIIATGNYVDMMIWVKRGVGTHIYQWGITGVSHFYINLFVCEILYTLALCVNKYSILLFFWRIFKSTSISIPIYVLAGIITAWGLGVIFTTVFQCIPLEGLWNYSVQAHCGVDINNFFIGNAVPNIITDWALLILPLPYVWSIHRNTVQKVALCATFAIGGLYATYPLGDFWNVFMAETIMANLSSICIISIVRLVIMLDAYKVPSNDVTWVFIGPSTWTAVETNIGIVSACLPSLRPILRIVSRKMGYDGSTDNGSHKLTPYSGYSSGSGKNGERFTNNSQLDGRIDVTTDMRVDIGPRYSIRNA